MENNDVDVERGGSPKQTLSIPRKPLQKAISSHFRENISPTTPTRSIGTVFADIETVSPESVLDRSMEEHMTGLFGDFELFSPQTTRDEGPTPELSGDLPAIQEVSSAERSLSLVSDMEEIRYAVPQTITRINEPIQSPPSRADNEYIPYRAAASQDDLLKTQAAKQHGPRNWISGSVDLWLVELSSLLVSLLACVAIIIILYMYDDHPISKWPHLMSINSLLALFTTLAEVGLMIPVSEALGQLKWLWFKEGERTLADFETIDQASRGPIGALNLLGRLKFGHLASIGAILSIVALAISPVTQQIISYRERQVPVSASAGISAQAARSDIFRAYNPIQDSTGVPDLSMQQAVKMGVFNPTNESLAAATPSCSTGNCTWPDFSSLGICSKVANVTSLLNVTTLSTNISAKIGYMVNNNATLPNGVFLQAGEMAMNITMPLTLVNGSFVSHVNHSLAFINEPNAAFTTISNYFVIWQNAQGQGQGDFGAIEVLLSWCVNTYSTHVQAGITITNITATSVNIASTNASITLPSNDGTNGTLQQHGALAMTPMNGTGNYTVDGPTNAALVSYMANTFRGTDSVGLGGGYTTDAAQALVSALFEQPKLEAVTGQAADNFQFAGVQNLTQNIAMSMTNNIRSRQFAGSPATGTSYVTETYIHVSWPWLSFLLFLLFSSFAVVIATMVKTRRAKVDVLRSSTLATICGLSQEVRSFMGPVDRRSGLLERAEGLRVRLQKGDLGWSLEGRGKGM